MSQRTIVIRETGISMTINAVLSIVFFLLIFGVSAPVTNSALALDFLPQAFMVSLMGSLVPGLMAARGGAVGKAPIIGRSLRLALAGLVLAGGGAYGGCMLTGHRSTDALAALVIKTAFGALLAAIVTPIAVLAVLNSREGRPV
jgi:hypothetical protein